MGLTIYNSIEEGTAELFGSDVAIESMLPVHGGDINESRLLRLSNGRYVFAKLNTLKHADFFAAEEAGINAIASTGAIETPRLLFRGADEKKGISFLVMEQVESSAEAEDFWEEFGRNLAYMHKADTAKFTQGGSYGFDSDNYIGATEQINSVRDSWIDFFRECRLEPQIKRADSWFDDGIRRMLLRFLDKLPELLVEPNKPSLLHGDLWSGNFMVGSRGQAVLIDPAVFVGHYEADLAMTELFGGFSGRFYKAYSEINPICSDYKDRRDVYNIYHMLNHLNLFGGMYLREVMRIAGEYL